MRVPALALFAFISGWGLAHAQSPDLRAAFASPPPDTRPGCYWYWINDNISKEGITKDLEAMARVGIGRAYIGHICNRKEASDTPVGTVKFMSDAWWDALQWAVKEAGRVGVDIGFFNSPGWSQSGGPWIKPSQSMRFLDASETVVEGGRKIDQVLPVPEIHTHPKSGGSKPLRTGPNYTAAEFQNVRVIAFRQPAAETKAVLEHRAEYPVPITTEPQSFDFTTDGSGKWQSIELKPLDMLYTLTCVVSASDDGKEFREIARHVEERGCQGGRIRDPLLVPFPPTRAKQFRVTLSATKPIGLARIALSPRAALAHYVRKQLGETIPSGAPPWETYIWKTQPPPAAGSVVDCGDVVDLTKHTDASGRLVWDAPAGRWVILRMGMVPIGSQCGPASPEASGLEVDKMSKEHIRSLFDGMVGEFIRRTPAADRKALKYVIADSYETGPQNWTDGMLEKFQTRFGYSPLPYLPCLHGRIVNSPEITDRFLWDWRRLIAESIARDYVGGLREVAHEHGLTLWLENYGHWGFPSEFLLYGSMTDQVGGEFWEDGGPEGNIELRVASSAAHIYGRTDVYAEAYTSHRTFQQSPASMKSWTDWAYSAGINHFILHVYIHQPDERKPGILQWFGTDFNRHTT
ncbi:MAG TPA: glycosyl hydrolase, partial [Luteolibacter sp.]|nr:glycosyl hydrolase [Luteolibacter sp.]